MNKIEINGNQYILNLIWTRISEDRVNSEINSTVKESGMSYGIIRKSADNVHIGLTSDKNSTGKYSAAAMLAEVADNIVLVEKIGDDKYWICSINGGEVLAGSDIVITSEGVSTYVYEFSTVPSFGSDKIKVLGTEEVEAETGIEIDSYLSFIDIIDGNKPNNNIKIKKISGSNKNILIAVAVSLAISGLGYGIYNHLETQKHEELLRIQEHLRSISNTETRVDVQQVIEEAKIEESIEIDRKFKYKNSTYINTILEDVLNKIGKRHSFGWQINTLNISSNDQGIPSVNSNWTRNYGTIENLRSNLEASSFSFTSNGGSASVSFGTEYPKESYIKVYDNIIKDKKDTRVQLIDSFLNSDIRIIVDRDSNFTNRERAVAINNLDGPDALRYYLQYNANNFTISGNGVTNLRNTFDILMSDKFNSSVINSVEMIFEGNLSWQIIGVIYEI